MPLNRLKSWREANDLTQRELAEQLGVHVQYVSAIERGARRPGMRVAIKIREVTQGAVTVDDLAGQRRKAA